MKYEIKKLHHDDETPLEVCSVRDYARIRAAKHSNKHSIWLVVWECGQLKTDRHIISFAKDGKVHWAVACDACNGEGRKVTRGDEECKTCSGLKVLISHENVEAA